MPVAGFKGLGLFVVGQQAAIIVESGDDFTAVAQKGIAQPLLDPFGSLAASRGLSAAVAFEMKASVSANLSQSASAWSLFTLAGTSVGHLGGAQGACVFDVEFGELSAEIVELLIIADVFAPDLSLAGGHSNSAVGTIAPDL